MLTHIVCWKYKPETTEEQKNEHINMLSALKAVIPDLLSLSVGRDILHLDRSFDTALVCTFADTEALERYSTHPEHQKVIGFGREIAQQAVSVDFTE